MRANNTTSTRHTLRETIRLRDRVSGLSGLYVRCVSIFLVVIVLALPAHAQESCSIGKGVPVGMQGLMCAAGGFNIQLAGKTSSGAGFFCDGQHDWTNKVWPELIPDQTYVMTAGVGICVTSINFDVPPGYTLEIDGIETTTVDKTQGGFIFTGDGSWNVVLRKKCACGKQGAGEGGTTQGSVVFHLGMGYLGNGQSAEQISIRQETLSSSIYTPASLVYSPPARSTAVDVVRDVSGNLRQVKAPQALADVVVINSSEYEVRYYAPANVGTKVNNIYTVTGQPYVTWKISNPSPTTTTKLRIAKLQGGITVDQSDYTWDPAIDLWSLGTGGTTPGNYSRVETKSVSYPTQTSRLETFIVKDGSGQIAAKHSKTYLNYPWGWELVQEVNDPDSAALTTTYTHYEDPNPDTKYRKLKSVTFPDGSWEKYDYDLVGNLSTVRRPWKDLSMASATEANSRLTIYGYSNSDNGVFGINVFPKIIFDIEEKIAGVTVTKRRFNRSQATANPYSIAEADSLYSGSVNGVPTTLVTQTITTRYHWSAPELLRNRVSAVEYPDGRKDYYSYEKGNYVTNPDPSLNQFTSDTNGLSERVTIVHGTNTVPAGIAFKTTKDVTVHDQFGNSVFQETYVYNGTDYERFAWTANDYDTRGHQLSSRDSRGQLTTAVWNVDLKTSEIDANGVETTYTYDPLGRVATKTKKGIPAGSYPAQADIVTTFAYDAEGRQTSETVSAGSPTLSLSLLRAYDRAGRVIKETDNASLNKAYTYTNGGRTQTVTHPGGATEINDRYLDGETKTVTGSAVVGRAFDYGVNADGTRYTQEFVGSGGLTSLRWTKTTIDWVGRTVFVTKPAFSGPDVVQATVYNNKNLKQSESVSANSIKLVADKLFEYDEMGNETRSGSDIDASGSLILASTDRLKETNVSYQKVGSDWLLVTNWRDYFVDNNDTPTTQTRVERLNNFSINGTDQTVSEISVTDLTGNSTKSTISIDRAAKRITEITDTYDSDLNRTGIAINGLLQSTSASTPQLPLTYTYDALGRQTSVTDPRKGTITAIYNNTTGQVLSTSNGFGTTSYEYYLGSQPGAGRLKSHTNPAGKKVYFNYSPRGEMVQTWGETTYPIEYLFDPYGQMIEMHTFRNGKGWTMSLWPTAATGAADITRFVYQDATGLLIQKQDAVGKAIVYTYDEMGRVKTRTWARGITSTYSYDANTGDPAGVSYSDSTPATTLAYDRVGRKKTITDAAGVRARTFTNNGQLQTEQITTGILDGINVNIGYDSFLRRSSLQSSSGANILSSQTYGYDSSSRLQTITGGSQTATYAYHPNSGLLNTTTFGTGTVTSRSYDTLGRLATISTSTPATGVVASYTYTYNNLYQRTKVTREDGSYWSYLYNDRGELADAKKYWADNTPYWGAQTEYSFDDVGNRISAKSGGNQLNQTRTSNFTTNSLNQYVQRTVPGALDVSGTANTAATVTVNDQSTARKGDYFYKELAVNNAAGPVDQNVSIKGARQNFGAGGQDAVTEQGGQILVPQSIETITYDFDGNLTSDSRFNYTWDAENRLVSVESAVNVPAAAKKRLEFAYDYMSRRVRKKVFSWNPGTSSYQLQSTTRYVYDEWNLIAEINEVNSLLKSYVWGQDLSGTLTVAGGIGGLLLINDSTNTYETSSDGNGNVAIVINVASGLPAATYEYDAFGNTIRATGSYANSNTIRFSSKYVDLETGLIYFGYRYYDPSTGRFINRDPLWENDGPNILTIVGNDPIDFVDPLGLRLSRETGAIAIRAGLSILKNACDRGCAPGSGSCCKPKGCKLESATLVELLVQAWLRNHGHGPYNDLARDSDSVGGYLCWDWARIFDDAATSRPFQCLGLQIGMALGPQDPLHLATYAVHYYLKVFACKKEEVRYQVTFDDGFYDGTAAHEGYFPPLGGIYLDEQYPSPIDRPAPFTPAPRPPTRP
jgi:RHS repeat-associated protein